MDELPLVGLHSKEIKPQNALAFKKVLKIKMQCFGLPVYDNVCRAYRRV